MVFFIKFYIEIFLILTIGMLMNPDNAMLKLSLLFVFLIWAIFHTEIIKRLYSKNENLNRILIDSIREEKENKSNKIKKNIKRFYFISLLFCLLISTFIKGGLLLPMGILIILIELLKFLKIHKLIKLSKTSSFDQEV